MIRAPVPKTWALFCGKGCGSPLDTEDAVLRLVRAAAAAAAFLAGRWQKRNKRRSRAFRAVCAFQSRDTRRPARHNGYTPTQAAFFLQGLPPESSFAAQPSSFRDVELPLSYWVATSMRRARRWTYYLTGAVAVAGLGYLAWRPLRRWLTKKEAEWKLWSAWSGVTSPQTHSLGTIVQSGAAGDPSGTATSDEEASSAVVSAFQVFRQQYETNKRTMTATIVSLGGLLQQRLERFFDTAGIIRKLRAHTEDTSCNDRPSEDPTTGHSTQLLWKQLTVLSLTRVLASAYVYCLLQALVCVQVNLLGRYLSLAAALAKSERYERRERRSSVQHSLPTEKELLTELLALPGANLEQPMRQVQRAYLRLARKLGDVEFLETLITENIMRRVQHELEERRWDLQTPLQIHDLASLWESARRCLCRREADSQAPSHPGTDGEAHAEKASGSASHASMSYHLETSVSPNGLWMASVLEHLIQATRQSLFEQLHADQLLTGPPRGDVEAHGAGPRTQHTLRGTAAQQAALQLNALLDETLDVIDSMDFAEFAEAIFDAVWRQMLADLEQTRASRDPNPSLALLQWLPKCAATSRQVFVDENYQHVARNQPVCERFAALVFLSGEKEGDAPGPAAT